MVDEISSMSQTESVIEPGEQPKSYDFGYTRLRSPLLATCTLSGLAAVISVAALVYSLRYGIELTPDGWAYWQSSVSMLEGRGYRYFFGPRIIEWPPLYPLYLVGWEYFLGVSGRTLVLANIALAGVAAFGWTALFLCPLWDHVKGSSHGHMPKQGVRAALGSFVIVIFVSSTIVSFYRSVLAQNLVYAVLPLLFYTGFRCTDAAGRAFLAFAALNGLLATLLLLAHNSAVAFLLPVAVVLACRRNKSLAIRTIAIFLSSVLPVVPWLAVRSWLDQLGSHPLGLSNFRLPEYLDQMIGGTADLLLTLRYGLGFVALLFIVGYIWHRLQQENCSSIIGSAIRTYLMLSVLASLCLLVIFMLTWINDPLGTRFILFLPLTLFCSAACLLVGDGGVSRPSASNDRKSFRPLPTWLMSGIYPTAILTCLTAVAVIRLAHWATYVDSFAHDFRITSWRPGEQYPEGAYRDFTIDPQVTNGLPIVRENKMIVPPPCYRWLELRMQRH
jgi:hypothetical protein